MPDIPSSANRGLLLTVRALLPSLNEQEHEGRPEFTGLSGRGRSPGHPAICAAINDQDSLATAAYKVIAADLKAMEDTLSILD